MSQEFIDAEMALFKQQAKEVDIIITTAQIPGKDAPKLLLKEHVEGMKAGSVIVDLAARSGGNCVLTEPGEIFTTKNGVTIIGKIDQLATQASELYGNNLIHLLEEMGGAQRFTIDMNNDIITRAMVTFEGNVNWPPEPLPVSPQSATKEPTNKANSASHSTSEHVESLKGKTDASKQTTGVGSLLSLIAIAALLFIVGQFAPTEFMQHFTVFVLAVFVGWQVIWNVSHALHTPLMAVTNAISGIIIIGGLLQVTSDWDSPLSILALIAVFVATINIVGGFYVTRRMLKMFKKGKND